MFGNKLVSIAAFFRIQDISDIPLLPQFDARFCLVMTDLFIAHLGEKIPQLLRFRAGELDKLKAIGASGVFIADHGFRGVMRKWTHAGFLL